MKTGEIHKWNTTKVVGYDSRQKYQLYIGKDSRNRHVFLMINSKNKYGEHYPLLKEDYAFLHKDKSYVCTTSKTLYSETEIESIKGNTFQGNLIRKDIVGLLEHVKVSRASALRDIRFIVSKLEDL